MVSSRDATVSRNIKKKSEENAFFQAQEWAREAYAMDISYNLVMTSGRVRFFGFALGNKYIAYLSDFGADLVPPLSLDLSLDCLEGEGRHDLQRRT